PTRRAYRRSRGAASNPPVDRRRRADSPTARFRCFDSLRPAAPTGRSPPSYSSAKRPWRVTSATSSPSSECHRGRRRPPTRTTTVWSNVHRNTHARRVGTRDSTDAPTICRLAPLVRIQFADGGTMNIDTVIVGAGQTGLATAYELKRRGRTAVVLHEHSRV